MTTLLDILGCKYPIIQGPIGQLNYPKMVAAVAEAGAIGVLATVNQTLAAEMTIIEDMDLIGQLTISGSIVCAF